MGHKSHTIREKMDFNMRLLKIYDKLPDNFMNLVLKKLPNTSVNRIQNVRYNKTVDFEILEILEKISAKHQREVLKKKIESN